jgi:hypothetical protein
VDHQIAFSLLGDSGCISNTRLKSVSPVFTVSKTSAMAVYRSIHTSQSDDSISSRKGRGWPETIAQPTLLWAGDSSLKILFNWKWIRQKKEQTEETANSMEEHYLDVASLRFLFVSIRACCAIRSRSKKSLQLIPWLRTEYPVDACLP